MSIECNQCSYEKDPSYFSNSQRSRPRSRCKACVNGGSRSCGDRTVKTARENFTAVENATPTWPRSRKRPSYFAEGVFRYVSKGLYTAGPRTGQDCVFKWLKPQLSLNESDFFSDDSSLIEKAIDLVQSFNDCRFIGTPIQVNRPMMGQFAHGQRNQGRMYQLEPFIKGFQKFNSNSGWVNDDSGVWGEIMQALSHFSYHYSSGQYVLCDLQGGVYSKGAVLTDPVILSRKQTYGLTDLGPEGINAFFFHHDCNDYCRSQWTRPRRTRPTISVAKHTTMLPRHVPTQCTKAAMTFNRYQSDSSSSSSSDSFGYYSSSDSSDYY